MGIPTAVEARVPSGQDEQKMAAFRAAQEVIRSAPTAVEGGALSIRDEEMMATPVAAQ